jgi:hypothetical protein
MSAETRQVLEMLTEGKITAADAERLLEKLTASASAGSDTHAAEQAPAAGAGKKFLRVMIERPGGDDVNVRVPLNMIRSGVKLVGVLPPKALEILQQEGIDPALLSQQSQEALDQIHVDMATKWGKRIRVFCE